MRNIQPLSQQTKSIDVNRFVKKNQARVAPLETVAFAMRLLLLMAFAANSHAAIQAVTVAQNIAKDCGTVAQCSQALPNPNSAGNLLIVFVRVYGTPTSASATDSLGTLLRLVNSCRNVSLGHRDFVYWGVARNGANTVNVSDVGGGGIRFEVTEFAGLPFPAFDTATCAGGANATPMGVAVTTVAGELVLAMASTSNTDTYVAGQGFTVLSTVSGKFSTAYAVAPGGSVAPSFTIAPSDGWAVATTAFKGTPAPPVDTTAPTVSIRAPVAGTNITGTQNVEIAAADDVSVPTVQLSVDGVAYGALLTAPPYIGILDTAILSAGPHTLTATAKDAAGNVSTFSEQVTVVGQLFDITMVYDDATPFAAKGTVTIAEPLTATTTQTDLVERISPTGNVKLRYPPILGRVYYIMVQDSAGKLLWQTGTELTPPIVPVTFTGATIVVDFLKSTGAWGGIKQLTVNY